MTTTSIIPTAIMVRSRTTFVLGLGLIRSGARETRAIYTKQPAMKDSRLLESSRKPSNRRPTIVPVVLGVRM